MAVEKFHIKQIPKELRNQEIWSRRAYVDWVNKTLQANFTNTLEFKNGAAYIQLLDSMFRGVVPMEEVKFCAEKQYDCYQNYRILEEAFKKLGINKILDTDALSSGRHVESWAFLKWFKSFYDHNFDGKDYDPVKARNSAYMGFGRNPPKNTKRDPSITPQCKRLKKLLTHTRSKSAIYNREFPQDEDEVMVNGKVQKTCRSVECLHRKKETEFVNKPGTPMKISASGETIGYRVKFSKKGSSKEELQNPNDKDIKEDSNEVNLSEENKSSKESVLTESQESQIESNEDSLIEEEIFVSKKISLSNKEKKVSSKIVINSESETTLLNKSMSFSNIIEEKLKEDRENETISKEIILVKKGYSQGDFNPQIQTEIGATQETSTKGEGQNINAIVVNKTQQYEEFGVRITENIQIRVESLESTESNVLSERERRRKLVLIEKFLKYQWSERKEYFQTLAGFFKEEQKKTK